MEVTQQDAQVMDVNIQGHDETFIYFLGPNKTKNNFQVFLKK